jgi:hypothetical protein
VEVEVEVEVSLTRDMLNEEVKTSMTISRWPSPSRPVCGDCSSLRQNPPLTYVRESGTAVH